MEDELFFETYGYHVEELDELYNQKHYRALKEKLSEMNDADIALYLEDRPAQQQLLLFRMLPKDTAADVFAFLSPEIQEMIINNISDKELSRIIEDLYVDDAVDMLEELPATVVRRVLKNASADTRSLINEFLRYPENSAGSIMTAEYLSLKKEMTVSESFDYIRSNGEDSETIYVLYVTDKSRHLEGIVTIKDLLMHRYEDLIADIMDENVIHCTTTDDQEDVAEMFTTYDLLSLAVTDTEDRLVGIVTVDDVVDVIEDEATEDIEKMAAILPTDKPYFKTDIFATWKSRIPWLLLLMVSATFTGVIINRFESALTACAVLTGFIPMLMDTAGNSGSQASVTIIRALSLGDVEFKDILKVVWKELRVAIVCGLTLAAVNFLKILLVDRLIFGNHDITLMVDVAVCLTLMVTVICAKLVGCVLPLCAERLGFDPAVMASPFITTIVDAVSLLIFFFFASGLLGLA